MARLDLSVEQGATYDLYSFRYLQDDGVTPVDLTGWTATGQVRDTAGSLVFSFTPTITALLGEVDFTFTATQTALLTSTSYVWGIELAKSGVVVRLVEGKILVSPEVVK